MMLDRKGRVWLTASVRSIDNPAFCKAGSDHPSAKLFPLKESHRQLAMLDPQTMKYTFVDTCFDTHHLQFGFDKDDTLWTSGGGPVVGWLDTKVFDETGDAAKARGWTALVLDTDGNGKHDAYVEPDQPVDPTKDKRIPGGFYANGTVPLGARPVLWLAVPVWRASGTGEHHGTELPGSADPYSNSITRAANRSEIPAFSRSFGRLVLFLGPCDECSGGGALQGRHYPPVRH
jgi:hypothetical protein